MKHILVRLFETMRTGRGHCFHFSLVHGETFVCNVEKSWASMHAVFFSIGPGVLHFGALASGYPIVRSSGHMRVQARFRGPHRRLAWLRHGGWAGSIAPN